MGWDEQHVPLKWRVSVQHREWTEPFSWPTNSLSWLNGAPPTTVRLPPAGHWVKLGAFVRVYVR